MKKTEPQVETYRDLLEEHAKLRGLLHDLERILADRPGPFGEVVERLRQLRELVDSHFEAEEASDCFPDLVNQAPRVSDRVKIMLAEHGELRAEIHGLVQGTEKCRGTAEDWDRLAASFQAFAARLMHHEQAENELVQEVFTEDIGSTD